MMVATDCREGTMGQILNNKTRTGLRAILLGLALTAAVVGSRVLFAQMTMGQLPPPGTPPDGSSIRPGQPPDPMQQEILQKMILQRNIARQQQLVKDTDKLLALATELKNDVDKTNKNVLSIDVIKKAEEIEKLAKNVKDRMKN
jgi:hypothetical protein